MESSNQIFITENETTESPIKSETTGSEFQAVKDHKFEYGLKTAAEKENSMIVLSNGTFELRYQPCDIQKEIWYGDCAADVLLSGKALKVGIRTIEAQTYDFPQANFKGSHYKLIYDGEVDGNHIYQPIDHSRFYKSLNPMNATEVVDTEFTDFEHEELVGDMNLDSLRNYEEFDIDGHPGLSMIGIETIGDTYLFSVCVYEQDDKGNVIRRYESSYLFDKNFTNERMDSDSVTDLLKFDKVHLTENGVGQFKPFDQGIVKIKTVEAFTSILNAYKRGK